MKKSFVAIPITSLSTISITASVDEIFARKRNPVQCVSRMTAVGFVLALLCLSACSKGFPIGNDNAGTSTSEGSQIPVMASVSLQPRTEKEQKMRRVGTVHQTYRSRFAKANKQPGKVGDTDNPARSVSIPTSFMNLGGDTYGVYNVSGDAVSTDSASNQGGAIIGTADLQLIFWGSEWNTLTSPSAGNVVDAVDRLMATDYFDGMHQYGFGGLTVRNPIVVQSPEPRFGFTFESVGALVWNLINQGTFPEPDDSGGRILYMVLMPLGSSFNGKASIEGAHGAPSDFNGTHAWVGFAEYGALAEITSVLSHEIVEVISDPEPDDDTRAWVMNRSLNGGNEIGDACANTIDVLDGVTVQAYWSQALRGCVIPFKPAPTLTFITPASSPPQGGASIRLVGTNFDARGNTKVFFGGVPALSVSCANTTECFATSRAGNGIVDVTVQVNRFTTTPNSVSKFSYLPSVLSLDKTTGTAGDTVSIHALGISNDVSFGPFAVTNIFCSPGLDCSVIVPPGFGTVDVRVRSFGSISAISAADVFTYTPPAITRMDVTSGSIDGGTYTNIFGSGFDPNAASSTPMQVFFGSLKSDFVVCNSTTSCKVRSMPASALGPVHVTFSTFEGPRSAPTAADVFTYVQLGLTRIEHFDRGGYLSLNGKAGPSGATVTLTSSDPGTLAVPATAIVPAGATGVSFAETGFPTNLNEAVTIVASLNGSTVSMTEQVTAWPTVSMAGPDMLSNNGTATVTVSLAAPAGTGGAIVTLTTDDSSAIPVPASVTVPAGSHQATFPITNHYSGSPKYVSVTAKFAAAAAYLTVAVPNEAICKQIVCLRGFHWSQDDCSCKKGLPN